MLLKEEMLLILLAAATQAAFENYASFKDCKTGINETFVDYAMPIYNLIEYSDNDSDTLGSLWGFKRDEVTINADVTNDNNAPLFKYKESIIDNTKSKWNKKWSKNSCTTKIYE